MVQINSISEFSHVGKIHIADESEQTLITDQQDQKSRNIIIVHQDSSQDA